MDFCEGAALIIGTLRADKRGGGSLSGELVRLFDSKVTQKDQESSRKQEDKKFKGEGFTS